MTSENEREPFTPSGSGEILRMVYGLKRRVRNLEWFLTLAFDLNRTIDRSESVNLIHRFFKANLETDGFSLWLIAPATRKFEAVAAYGVPAKEYLGHLQASRLQPPFKLGQCPEGFHYFPELPAQAEQAAGGSLLILPLMPESSGSVLGFLALFRQKKDSFSTRERVLLRETSQFIALHLRKITLFHTTRELAFVDSLTQIFNRRYFDQRFAKEIGRAQRYQRAMSVLMIDIDYFKNYNDLLGHLAGDEALRQVADLLEKNLRKADVVCRYGGEEFVVILPEISAEAAGKVAEKLRQAIAAASFSGEENLPDKHLTISIGVAAFPENGKNAEEMLKRADQALYKAKQSGRNRVMVSPQQDS